MPRRNSERGSITAEFSVVLPTVLLLIALSLSTLTAQFERTRLVAVAVGLARAVARGESESHVREVYATQLQGSTVTFSTAGLLLCAEVERTVNLLGLPNLPLRLADRECSRTMGL